MIVMLYARGGNLLSYLNENINAMTWEMKLSCLRDIAIHLNDLHDRGLVHCDLHGGNIVLKDDTSKTKGDVDPSVRSYVTLDSLNQRFQPSQIQSFEVFYHLLYLVCFALADLIG